MTFNSLLYVMKSFVPWILVVMWNFGQWHINLAHNTSLTLVSQQPVNLIAVRSRFGAFFRLLQVDLSTEGLLKAKRMHFNSVLLRCSSVINYFRILFVDLYHKLPLRQHCCWYFFGLSIGMTLFALLQF